jgi:hypothetical protein
LRRGLTWAMPMVPFSFFILRQGFTMWPRLSLNLKPPVSMSQVLELCVLFLSQFLYFPWSYLPQPLPLSLGLLINQSFPPKNSIPTQDWDNPSISFPQNSFLYSMHPYTLLRRKNKRVNIMLCEQI